MKRRSVLSGVVGAGLALAVGRGSRAQTGQPADLAGCLAEPGIALFLDVFQGRSNLTSQDLLAGADWQLFSSPYTLVAFLYPPDWSPQVLFANSFTQNAAPIWSNPTPQSPGIISARVVSLDSTAAWEYVAGTLTGVALTVEQAIAIAEGGVFGDGFTGTRLCVHTEPTINGGTAWLTATESNGLLALTNGTLFADASDFSPYSVLTWYSLVAPRTQYEQFMRQVFIPIQWQLLQSGGSEPIPTPTPGV